jgi:hypothetical protein
VAGTAQCLPVRQIKAAAVAQLANVISVQATTRIWVGARHALAHAAASSDDLLRPCKMLWSAIDRGAQLRRGMRWGFVAIRGAAACIFVTFLPFMVVGTSAWSALVRGPMHCVRKNSTETSFRGYKSDIQWVGPRTSADQRRVFMLCFSTPSSICFCRPSRHLAAERSSFRARWRAGFFRRSV